MKTRRSNFKSESGQALTEYFLMLLIPVAIWTWFVVQGSDDTSFFKQKFIPTFSEAPEKLRASAPSVQAEILRFNQHVGN